MSEHFDLTKDKIQLPPADPTLSSRIFTPEEYSELATKASKTRHGELVMLADGARFFRIERKNDDEEECVPETQHAIAMILKGIVNLADIVSVTSADGKEKYHFSYALDLKDIAGNENPYALGVQQVFLDTLFGDLDHHVFMVNNVPSNDPGSNVRTSEDSKRFYFFDFAQAFDEAFLNGRTYSRDYIQSRLAWVNQSETHRTEFLRILDATKERFEGSQGLAFIHSVVKKADMPMRKLFAYRPLTRIEAMLNGGFERHFRNEILRRITFMQKYLEKTPVTPLPKREEYSGPLQ